MHVFHTAGVPPSSGSSIFAIIGWIEKRSAELTKIVTPNSSVCGLKTFIASDREDSKGRINITELIHRLRRF
jgi:hypothetical protein